MRFATSHPTAPERINASGAAARQLASGALGARLIGLARAATAIHMAASVQRPQPASEAPRGERVRP
jgi:hypothetical protein